MVKPAPAKLCAAFLCILLNRLRFSLQNVEFWTKTPPQSLRDSSPKGAPFGAAAKLPATTKAVPLGKVA